MNKQVKEAPAGRQWIDLMFQSATDLETKALVDSMGIDALPPGYTAGWASTPDLDHYSHVVVPGAFDESIAEKGLTGPKGIKLLIQHDRDRPAGLIKVLKTVGGKLWMEAEMNLDIGYVSDFYKAAKMVGGMSFSVGFYVEDYEFKSVNEEEILYITKGELEEVSVVTFPGNPEAVMTYLKEAPIEGTYKSIAEFEKALQAEGLVKSRNAAARLTQVVKQNLALFAPAAKPLPAPVAKEKIAALSTLIGDLKGLF
jgi:HK97 family phage prohead protease